MTREVLVGNHVIEATLLPGAGARLHRLRAFGAELLQTPAHPVEHLRDPFAWGAYVMAPWANRIAAGATPVGDRIVRVPANFSDGTAIHGQVASERWTVARSGRTFRVRRDADGWPWAYEVELTCSVRDTTLAIGLTLTNRSSEPMPGGLGLHPWWTRPLRVAVPGELVYPSNTRPPDRPEPARGNFDLRSLAAPTRGVDATWTAVDGPVELAWPALEIAATLRLSGAGDHVVVAAPVGTDATALEVQTHAPDGLRRMLDRLPGALRELAPGETLELGIELDVQQT